MNYVYCVLSVANGSISANSQGKCSKCLQECKCCYSDSQEQD